MRVLESAANLFFDSLCEALVAGRYELLIFACTLVSACFIKHGFGRPKAWAKAAAVEKEVDLKRDAAAVRSSVPRAPRSSVVRAPAPMQQQQQHQQQQQPRRDRLDLTEKVRTIVTPHATQRLAAQACHVYVSLRQDLGLNGEDPEHSATEQSRWALQRALKACRCGAIDLYTSLVNSAVRSSQCHLVEGFVKDMRALGVTRTPSFYESTMKQLAGQKQHRLALAMYDMLVEDGQEASAVTCSCLISFASEVGQYDRAIQFYRKLESMTIPSIRACMTILRVYSKQLNWKGSVDVLRDMRSRGINVDSLALNIVLASCVGADRIEEAQVLLNEHSAVSDVVSYNTLAKGFAQRSAGQSAHELLDLVRKRGLEPNAITFNTVMDAVVREGGAAARERIPEILKQMRTSGAVLDKFTCSIIVRLVGRDVTPENVLQALSVLREVGERCETSMRVSLYNSLVEAVGSTSEDVMLVQIISQMRQQKLPIGEQAMQLLKNRQPKI